MYGYQEFTLINNAAQVVTNKAVRKALLKEVKEDAKFYAKVEAWTQNAPVRDNHPVVAGPVVNTNKAVVRGVAFTGYRQSLVNVATKANYLTVGEMFKMRFVGTFKGKKVKADVWAVVLDVVGNNTVSIMLSAGKIKDADLRKVLVGGNKTYGFLTADVWSQWGLKVRKQTKKVVNSVLDTLSTEQRADYIAWFGNAQSQTPAQQAEVVQTNTVKVRKGRVRKTAPTTSTKPATGRATKQATAVVKRGRGRPAKTTK